MKLMPLFLFVLLMAVGPADPVAQNVKPDQDSRLKAYPFELRQVRLLEGPFRDAMLRDQKYLLGLEPDRLLHMFRVTAGLPSSAKPYGG